MITEIKVINCFRVNWKRLKAKELIKARDSLINFLIGNIDSNIRPDDV